MSDRFILTPYRLDEPVPGLEPLAAPDWRINKAAMPASATLRRMAALYRPLADFVAGTIDQGERPVSLAGDCCTTIGVLAGLQRAGLNPNLIWFDAHGDFNTWETTPSGFLGGMPLAMLAGLGEQTICQEIGLKPQPDDQIILSDGRDLDPGERALLDASAVTHVAQVEQLMTQTLPDGPLYVHFDTDLIDPAESPAMDYATPGGPSVATAERLFRYLARTGRVAAVSMCCWNPELAGAGRSRQVSMKLLAALLS
jgi:arginase